VFGSVRSLLGVGLQPVSGLRRLLIRRCRTPDIRRVQGVTTREILRRTVQMDGLDEDEACPPVGWLLSDIA
jgi:hypothetical protein